MKVILFLFVFVSGSVYSQSSASDLRMIFETESSERDGVLNAAGFEKIEPLGRPQSGTSVLLYKNKKVYLEIVSKNYGKRNVLMASYTVSNVDEDALYADLILDGWKFNEIKSDENKCDVYIKDDYRFMILKADDIYTLALFAQ